MFIISVEGIKNHLVQIGQSLIFQDFDVPVDSFVMHESNFKEISFHDVSLFNFRFYRTSLAARLPKTFESVQELFLYEKAPVKSHAHSDHTYYKVKVRYKKGLSLCPYPTEEAISGTTGLPSSIYKISLNNCPSCKHCFMHLKDTVLVGRFAS